MSRWRTSTAISGAHQALGNHCEDFEPIDVGAWADVGKRSLTLGIVPVADVREVDVQTASCRPGMNLEPGVKRSVILLEYHGLLHGHGLLVVRFERTPRRLRKVEKVLALELIPSGMQEARSLGVDFGDGEVGTDGEECVWHRLQSAGELLVVLTRLHHLRTLYRQRHELSHQIETAQLQDIEALWKLPSDADRAEDVSMGSVQRQGGPSRQPCSSDLGEHPGISFGDLVDRTKKHGKAAPDRFACGQVGFEVELAGAGWACLGG